MIEKIEMFIEIKNCELCICEGDEELVKVEVWCQICRVVFCDVCIKVYNIIKVCREY